MQHIIIKYDNSTNQPYIIPEKANIWRDDQSVMWSIAAPNVWWDPAKAPPVVFVTSPNLPPGFSDWPGSQPSPIGTPPVPPAVDRRRYVSDAGSPNDGPDVIKYIYDAWVEWEVPGPSGDVIHRQGRLRAHRSTAVVVDGMLKLEGVPIDPEILNQPQP